MWAEARPGPPTMARAPVPIRVMGQNAAQEWRPFLVTIPAAPSAVSAPGCWSLGESQQPPGGASVPSTWATGCGKRRKKECREGVGRAAALPGSCGLGVSSGTWGHLWLCHQQRSRSQSHAQQGAVFCRVLPRPICASVLGSGGACRDSLSHCPCTWPCASAWHSETCRSGILLGVGTPRHPKGKGLPQLGGSLFTDKPHPGQAPGLGPHSFQLQWSGLGSRRGGAGAPKVVASRQTAWEPSSLPP